MKRTLMSILVVLMLFGCSSPTVNESVLECDLEEMGMNINFQYTFKDDVLSGLKTKVTLPYTKLGVTKEQAEFAFDEEAIKKLSSGLFGNNIKMNYELTEKSLISRIVK